MNRLIVGCCVWHALVSAAAAAEPVAGLTEQLRDGDALLGKTSAAIRRLGPGATIRLTTATLKVGGVVPDVSVGGHEVFVSRATASSTAASRAS